MANRATGKGYENETFYTNIKFQFWGIDNIHVMRASLQKLVEGSSLMCVCVCVIRGQCTSLAAVVEFITHITCHSSLSAVIHNHSVLSVFHCLPLLTSCPLYLIVFVQLPSHMKLTTGFPLLFTLHCAILLHTFGVLAVDS